jgi:hypothetical protein
MADTNWYIILKKKIITTENISTLRYIYYNVKQSNLKYWTEKWHLLLGQED